MSESKKLLRVSEAAEYCSVSTRHFYHLVKIGVIPSKRVGDTIRICPDELNAAIAATSEEESK